MARMSRPGFATYRLPSRRWQLHGYWWEGGQRSAKKMGTFPTRQAATTAGDVWKAKVLLGDHVAPSALTVGGWLDQWLDLCEMAGLRPRTIYDYRNKLRLYVRPTLGDVGLQDLEPHDLDEIYSTMAVAGLSPRTIRYTHSIVRKALADAVRKGALASNPAQHATPPRARAAKAAERTVWTPDQLGTFLDGLAGSTHQGIFHVLATTGMRRSEACALQWSAVDLERGVLEVRAGVTEVATTSLRRRPSRHAPLAPPKTERDGAGSTSTRRRSPCCGPTAGSSWRRGCWWALATPTTTSCSPAPMGCRGSPTASPTPSPASPPTSGCPASRSTTFATATPPTCWPCGPTTTPSPTA